MATQKVIISNHIAEDLQKILAEKTYSSVFVLTDTESQKYCFPQIIDVLPEYKIMEIKSGDENKNINTLTDIWTQMSNNGATRRSLMINLGGGMITDLGGFAASTFKRGIDYINIPTTLLGAIDAAVGGKTGINFLGLKNEIGVINPAGYVLIDSNFFKTLDRKNFLSGYAEMLKHALISSEEDLEETLRFNLTEIDYKALSELIKRSVKIKETIVAQDPDEQNIRKALNFGHTIGHAFESFSHETKQPILHGYAIAYGMISELYLSYKKTGFPREKLKEICRLITEIYGAFDISCKDYPRLYEWMTHDKKNISAAINFTLLQDVGNIKINQTATQKEIFEALDFYRDMVENDNRNN